MVTSADLLDTGEVVVKYGDEGYPYTASCPVRDAPAVFSDDEGDSGPHLSLQLGPARKIDRGPSTHRKKDLTL